MKHSIRELIATAHEYFPRGIARDDPRYEQTPEVLHQKAARVPVSAQYNRWRAMLQRLEARFPEDQFPGVDIQNNSLFLQGASVGTPWDRCFTGALGLPPRTPDETHHALEFLVSFVVPCYIVCSSCLVEDRAPFPPIRSRLFFEGDTCLVVPIGADEPDIEPPSKKRFKRQARFDLSPDELPFAKAIAEEIEATFPGHEPIPPEVGLTVVPEVQAGNKLFGEATIFTCLFSDNW